MCLIMKQKGFIYAGNLLQTINYYPSSVPFTLTDDDPVTDRLHTGKPFIDMQGLGYYDNNARFLDILTGSFISVDPLAGKYPSLTPTTTASEGDYEFAEEIAKNSRNNVWFYIFYVKSKRYYPF